jgi:hypothetical protein
VARIAIDIGVSLVAAYRSGRCAARYRTAPREPIACMPAMWTDPAAGGVPPDVGDVCAHGRVVVRGRLPPLAGGSAGDAPPVSVLADIEDIEDRVGGEQPASSIAQSSPPRLAES